jgi:hypothetical protein
MEVALDALKQEFVRTTGHPPAAEHREVPDGRYWWKLSADCWVQYTITDVGGLFGTRTRTIEVMGFQPESPA